MLLLPKFQPGGPEKLTGADGLRHALHALQETEPSRLLVP